MRRSARNLWPSLLLLLSACSLVVDFPEPRAKDGGVDGGGKDAETDAGTDGGRCDPSTPTSCGDGFICCETSGTPTCLELSSTNCTSCGGECGTLEAPNCGDRVCECVVGTGEGCMPGQRCLGDGGDARCVECVVDGDCTGTNKQCVANKCLQCDRGAKLDDSSDDQGCPPKAPICNAQNRCEACSTTPNNCPSGQECNPGVGCLGCTLAPVGMNGCGTMRPICKAVMVGSTQERVCQPCTNNKECEPNYCDSRPDVGTGECVAGCDPDGAVGNNGCSGGTPFCKATPTGFACAPCAAGDCTGSTPYCAATGAKAGQCVVCRGDADCTGSGTAPVCDATTGTCRAQRASDCTGTSKPVFDPASMRCVECLTSTQCAANPNGTICEPSSNTCGRCATNADCAAPTPTCNTTTTPSACVAGCTTDASCASTPATPRCDTMLGRCVACTTDAQCAATPATPLCVAGACSACTALAGAADARCAMLSATTPVCVTAGTLLGRCGTCSPGVGAAQKGCSGTYCSPTTATCIACDVTSEQGCEDTPTTTQCIAPASASGAPGCYACDPAKPTSCPTGSTCSAPTYTCSAVPVTDAGTPAGPVVTPPSAAGPSR